MNSEKWGQVYEPVPANLDLRLNDTLSRLQEEESRGRRLSLRTAAIALVLLLALGGVAYAVLASQVADIYGWFFGEETKERLLTGDIALPGQSYTLGDVVYTLDEVVYQGGLLYGTGTMRPRDGSNVVLMASDHYVWEEAGYILHVGDEEQVPEDAPTYLELAEERNAKIIQPICYVQGYIKEDGELSSSEVGNLIVPTTDGVIRFAFDFEGYAGERIQQSDTYVIRFKVASWEIDREGNPLREEPQNTFVWAEWDVPVAPQLKGE